MSLNAKSVEAAKPKPKTSPKDYKIYDEKGLYLLVKAIGSKYWRFRYRFDGKEKLLALGVYPKVSLSEARRLQDKAAKLLDASVDPSTDRKQRNDADKLRKANTFEAVARGWFKEEEKGWKDRHASRVIYSLEKEIFPHIGDMPITKIRTPDIKRAINLIQKRGAFDIAKRSLQRCSSVFSYAVQSGIAETNPARELIGSIKSPKVKHQPSLKREELPEFLKRIDGYDGLLQTKLALRLLVHTFVRPGELRKARWEEFNLDAKEWRIPGERMKMNIGHIVPLTKQVIKILKDLEPLTGRFELLLPGERKATQPMSENTLLFALYRLGYKGKATPHGFRASASSILNEQNFNSDAIERQLSHIERNKVKGAYNYNAEFMKERKKIMKWWSDYLDDMEQEKIVIAGKFKRKQ